MENKKRFNGWKLAFFTLLGIIIGLGLFLSVRIFADREPEVEPAKIETTTSKNPILTINTHKKQVNQIISYYLEDYQKKSEISYDFYLENEALLTGEIKLLSVPVKFYLYFDPYVTENGNVQLKAKSISVGKLGVPVPEVLNFAKKNYTLPKWVEIQPKKQMIVLRLDQLKLKNQMKVKADKIDLINDEITFELFLPQAK